MTLPGMQGYKSLVKGNNDYYNCAYESKLVIPVYREVVKDGVLTDLAYLFYYDLSKPLYTTLIQRYYIDEVVNFYSIRIVGQDEDMYIYLHMDVLVTVIKCYPNYILSVPESYTPYFLNQESATFQIGPTGGEILGASQNLTVHGVKSGMILENLVTEIKIQVTADEEYVSVNVDDYFSGYRKFVDVYYPHDYSDNKAGKLVTDDTLAKFTSRMTGGQRFEFSSIQDEYHIQKKLIYLKNNTYLYVD